MIECINLTFVWVSFRFITKQPTTRWFKTCSVLFSSWFGLGVLCFWAGLAPVFAVSQQNIWQLAGVIGQLGHMSLSHHPAGQSRSLHKLTRFQKLQEGHTPPQKHFLKPRHTAWLSKAHRQAQIQRLVRSTPVLLGGVAF